MSHLTSDAAATWHVQSPFLHAYIVDVERIVAEELDRSRAVKKLEPAFARLLDVEGWLPPAFTEPDASGGMGAGLGNYLIYRSAQRDLSLMSLVVPAAATTPVHDHLAWG